MVAQPDTGGPDKAESSAEEEGAAGTESLPPEATDILSSQELQSDSSIPAVQAHGSESDSVPPSTMPPPSRAAGVQMEENSA